MKSKQIGLKEYIKKNKRKVQIYNLNDKQGFTFEDDKLLEIRKKIEAAGVRLGEIGGVEVTRGVETGANEIFIIDETTYKSLGESPFIHKVIHGKTPTRYGKRGKISYIIYVAKGYTNKNRGNMTPEEYMEKFHRNVYSHLVKGCRRYRGKGLGVTNRNSQGEYWWESKKDCDYSEYTAFTQYGHAFDAVYIHENEVPLNRITIIRGKEVKWLVALFNSKIFDSYFRKCITQFLNGDMLKHEGIINTSYIPNIIVKDTEKMNTYVDQIQSLKKEGKPTDHLEAEVEKIVQELYGLTDEEVEYLCKE